MREPTVTVQQGDARQTGLPDQYFHCCCTSAPYFGLREYGDDDREIGDEQTPQEYVDQLVQVGQEVRRVLRQDGVWWLNLGDSYANDAKWGGRSGNKNTAGSGSNRDRRDTGVPAKSLVGVPWRVALALQADGWILRSAVPWLKANVMPESVRDRPTVGHEYLFMLVKSERYFWDPEAVRRPQRADTLKKYQAGFTDRYADAASGGYRGKFRGANGPTYNENGRNVRTTDFFDDSLGVLEDTLADLTAQGRTARAEGGMVVDVQGDPKAFFVSTVASKLAHFAMWPPRLVAPMVQSSTSAGGCCADCGAPYRRLLEPDTVQKVRNGPGPDKHTEAVGGKGATSCMHTGLVQRYRTVRWDPTCGCQSGAPVPCRVLDCFAGSGTTGQVARALGRDCTLVELMQPYLAVIAERLQVHLDPTTWRPYKREAVAVMGLPPDAPAEEW